MCVYMCVCVAGLRQQKQRKEEKLKPLSSSSSPLFLLFLLQLPARLWLREMLKTSFLLQMEEEEEFTPSSCRKMGETKGVLFSKETDKNLNPSLLLLPFSFSSSSPVGAANPRPGRERESERKGRERRGGAIAFTDETEKERKGKEGKGGRGGGRPPIGRREGFFLSVCTSVVGERRERGEGGQ